MERIKDYPGNSFEKYITVMKRERETDRQTDRQTDRKKVNRADVACSCCRVCIAMGR